MDYKYIEQLLERYWLCETNLEEESILRSFFSQEDIPVGLRRYKALFACQQAMGQNRLGDDFDAKVLARIAEDTVKAQRITPVRRLVPLYKAAASVAILLTLGTAAQKSFGGPQEEAGDYNYSHYEDTYSDPEVAYDRVSDALQQVSACLNRESSDTLTGTFVPEQQNIQE